MRWPLLPAAALLATALIARGEAAAPKAPAWDQAAAARYLDARLAWWRAWPKAQRDHGTACVSCHTALPHALSRPTLRAAQPQRSPAELAMFDDVTERVWLWREVEPFYPDQTRGIPKSSESRAVEAVLNALILSTRDAERGVLGPNTRQAFANMWAQQMQFGDQKGGFPWLNFKLEPWEAPNATIWGATLASLAVARAPGYMPDPAALEALRAYLRGGLGGSLHNRALILWADSQIHGILAPTQRQQVIAELSAAQGADGGWSLPALAPWQRIDGSTLPSASDGYATAIIALALREAGMETKAPVLARARLWMISHQDKATGALPAKSINKDRQSGTDAYLFMSDQATGLASLALRPGG